MNRRQACQITVAATLGGLLPRTAARADTYPDRPVKIIVPIGAGGSYDLVGRFLATKLSDQMGQGFFVENRTGAGTVVGTQAAAAAAPDGYTLLMGGLSNIVFNAALYQNLPYQPLTDFVPVALVYKFPYALVARQDLPQKTVHDIIETGRQKPDQLTLATAGSGTGQQIVGAAFMKASGAKLLEVPYKSAQAAYPDILSGRVDLFFDSASAALPYITSGKVRGMALLAPERSPLAPDMMTLDEAGVPGLGVESWIGLFAPAKTPPDILARLETETRRAAAELKGRFETTGGSLLELPSERTRPFVAEEYERWTKLIREAGIRLD